MMIFYIKKKLHVTKQLRIIIILILFGFKIYAQKSPNISDSVVYAFSNSDSYLHSELGYSCTGNYRISIPQKTLLFVSNVIECKGYKYYTVFYDGDKYFIDSINLYYRSNNLYDSLNNLDSLAKDILSKNSKRASDLIILGDENRVLDEINNKEGLYILNLEANFENEIKDTKIRAMIYNSSNKIIKYIWFTFIAYNAVDDKVIDKFTGSSKVIFNGIGPIKPKNKGIYNFDYDGFSGIVDNLKATSIKVQYMDRSFKTFNNLSKITLSKDDFIKYEGLIF